jgi:hypothetical protein
VGLLAGSLLRQRWLGYLASAIGATLALIALVNLAGGFDNFDTGTKHRQVARPAPPTAQPGVQRSTSPPVHNVYYLVESAAHAQAISRGEEALPPSLDPAPTKTVVLIAATQGELNALLDDLYNTSFEFYLAGSPFTYELIDLRR